MIHQLVETLLGLATKMSVLAGMRNFLDHLVNDGVCPVFEHLPSAGWAGLNILVAVFTNNVSNRAGSNWAFPGDEETHWTLKFIQEAFKSFCCHYQLVSHLSARRQLLNV